MGFYALALSAIAIVAEALGLGGVPEHALLTENIFFCAFLLALIVVVCKRFARD